MKDIDAPGARHPGQLAEDASPVVLALDVVDQPVADHGVEVPVPEGQRVHRGDGEVDPVAVAHGRSASRASSTIAAERSTAVTWSACASNSGVIRPAPHGQSSTRPSTPASTSARSTIASSRRFERRRARERSYFCRYASAPALLP